MSLTSIPDQPITFSGSPLQGCLCRDPEDRILADPTDTLVWQMRYDPCLSALQNTDPDFSQGEWANNGWTITAGQACPREDFGSITDAFVPTVGNTYVIQIVTSSLPPGYTGDIDPLFCSFGGVSLGPLAFGAGYQFTVTATDIQPLIFFVTQLRGQAPCVLSAYIYSITPEITVALSDGYQDVRVFTVTSHPERFTFVRDRVIITYPLVDDDVQDGCYTLLVGDECDGTLLEGPVINVRSGTCSVLITTCIDNDAMELVGPFSTSRRIVAKVVRPSFEYQVAEDRLTDGTVSRYYGRRNRTYELRTEAVGPLTHEYLSSLPLWHHVYIEQREWVVRPETYAPGYGDVYDGHGGVVMTIEPKRDNSISVRCGPEGGGCAPPPNFHVQGTGPNNDYILTADLSGRITIAE